MEQLKTMRKRKRNRADPNEKHESIKCRQVSDLFKIKCLRFPPQQDILGLSNEILQSDLLSNYKICTVQNKYF